MSHKTDAIVITCIDFRFQKLITNWLNKTLGDYKFDRVALAGGIFDLETILKQIDISVKLHQIKKVFLINHEDCGAYGKFGSFARHRKDLLTAQKKINQKFTSLNVKTYYLHLNGRFEQI